VCSSDLGGNSDPVVAEVGDQEITQSQFRQAYEQRYQQYRSLLGESLRADLFDQGQFRGAILDDMVQESALRQFAKESGYRASDATLRDFLIAIPAFQKDGQFSADTYKSLLQQKGLKTDRYEAQVRESLVIDQLRASVQDTAFVTPAEAWEAYRLENQSRELAVVAVAAAAFREKVQLSDEQIASRYEADKSRYMAPERIKLSYIELDRTKLAAADAPAAEALRALYDAEKEARFGSAEERKASHILIGFGADKDAAKKKAEDLLTQIRGGGDFAALAKSNSEDPGSKDNGGDLGWIKKGMMVPRFEEAVFGLAAAGDYAGPVETEFGWHLIRLDEVKAAATRAFEDADVQTELLEAYRAREADRRFQELSTKLEQLAFEKPALEPVAQELGLSVQTTDWFSRSGGSGIAGVEAVKQAVFSPEVLTDGENSKPIPAGPDSVVVVRKAEYEAARQKPLEEVRDLVRESLVVDESLRLAKAEAEALMAEVKAGADQIGRAHV
jgi:peptidyl-prolyl cis-trans isomerase D